MSIAITGVTGHTGQYLVDLLRKAGFTGMLRCLVRPSSVHKVVNRPGVEYVEGDCSNQESIVRLISGTDMLIHLAGIHTAEVIVASCRRSGYSRVVFVNTTGMFSKYRKYAEDYRRIDEGIQASGLAYTILRPTMIYGSIRDRNISRLIRIVDRMSVVPVIDGGQALMQPIHVEDLAQVIVSAALNQASIHRCYNVAGKEALKYADLLENIADALDKRIRLVNVPYWMAMFAGLVGEVIPNGLLSVEKIRRLREDKAFDYAEAQQRLSFNPRSFREGIRLEVDSMRRSSLLGRSDRSGWRR